MSQITHVVLVRWKPDTSEAAIGGVRELSQSLRKAIPGIETLREGPSVSPEGLEGGFAYGLVIEFEDEGARDAYLVHPAHLPLAEALRANAESLVVFDLGGS
jgi:hypothetical protein